MHLESELSAALKSRNLSRTGRAELSCRLAKQLEKAGEYESACEALVEFWPDRNGLPKLEGLDEITAAEVLLRVGALSGWQGSVQQSTGSQETAKNLVTRSLELFSKLGRTERVAEARGDLALCYWREGSFDEARTNLANALASLRDEDNDLRAVLLIRAGIVEVWARRLNEALRIYGEAAPLLERTEDHSLKGAFHNESALLFRKLSAPENSNNYLDRALIEYAAACFHFEQAGHTRYQACVENNLGFLFFTLGRFSESHQHLNRAGRLFRELSDNVHLAQVDETRARALLAEGRLHEAERFARSSLKTLERGGEQALLAEALTTYGVVVARRGRPPRARAFLERAVEVAETAGDLEGAGRAKLAIIEELGEQTPTDQLVSIYQSANELLNSSQDPATAKRLIACARTVVDVLGLRADTDPEHTWEGFSFKKEVVRSERALIERALRDAGGIVTQAARLLGFKHHQSLISLINSRHKDLLKSRSAVKARRRNIGTKARRAQNKSTGEVSQISILHAEDNKLVASLLGHLMDEQDWRIELCEDGDNALRKLTGNDHFDLFLLDNELPGLSGLELVHRARKMTHRRRTPILMISGSDCETAAWRAGVDAFLKKPDEIESVPATIARLLNVDLKD